MALYLVLYAIFHLVCSVIAYGMFFADFQSIAPMLAREHRRQDMGAALCFSLFGLFSLFAAFLSTGFAEHGLKFK